MNGCKVMALIIWWESWPYSEGQQKKAVNLHSFPDIIRGHSFRQGLDWQYIDRGKCAFIYQSQIADPEDQLTFLFHSFPGHPKNGVNLGCSRDCSRDIFVENGTK